MAGGKPEARNDYSTAIGFAVAIVVGVALWSNGSADKAPAEAPKIVPATAEQKEVCAGMMGRIGKTGVIKDRPSARRIDVDEAGWAGLPYKVKQAVLACLAIDAYGTTDPPGVESTVAYGFHTGKRIDQW